MTDTATTTTDPKAAPKAEATNKSVATIKELHPEVVEDKPAAGPTLQQRYIASVYAGYVFDSDAVYANSRDLPQAMLEGGDIAKNVKV